MSHSNDWSNPQKSAAEIAAKLDQILNAIMPLHELLEGLENAETGLTERLEEVLASFLHIAKHLQTSAKALTNLAQTDELPLAQRQAFKELNEHLQRLDKKTSVMQADLRALAQYLGSAPSHATGQH